MWFGTYGGLNKYDGYKIISYRSERFKNNSLQSNSIVTIYEDQEGLIWIGTYGGGLIKFDPNTETFTQYKYLHLRPENNIVPKVASIYEDSSKTLWIGTSEGLDKFDRVTGKFINYRVNSDIHAENNINVVYEGPSKNFWIGTYLGLKLFDRKTGKFTSFKPDSNNVNSLSHPFVYSICEDPSGIVWIGTGGGGLNRYNPRTGLFSHFLNDPDNKNSLSNNVVWVIEQYEKGKLILGTELGINIFNKETKKFDRIINNPKDPQSLSNNYVRSIYKDKSGLIWVGTDGGGVNKMDIYNKKFHFYQFDVYNSNTLSNNNVFTIRGGTDKQIWIGTIEGGLNCYNQLTKQFTRYLHDPANPHSLSSNKILSLSVGQSGNVWIGTDRDGLCMLPVKSIHEIPQKTKFIVYRPDLQDPNTLNSDIIYSLLEDKSGTVWAGTWGRGLNKLTFNTSSKNKTVDYVHPVIKHFRPDSKDINSISSDIIIRIYQDRKGTIWLGTAGGLDKLVTPKKLINGRMQEADAFISYRFNPADSTSLSDDYVTAIYESKKGEMWVGTALGLNKMDREKGKFKVYTTKDGLPNDVVNGIMEDENGNLWLGTQSGIARFDPVKEKFRNYTLEDGLLDNVYSPDAFCLAKSGEMFYGGANGMTSFYPDSILSNPFAPQVMITDFKVLNESVHIGRIRNKREILNSSISRAKEIYLSYKDYVLSFEFSASNYANPLKNMYAFKLEGFDQDWVYTNAGNRDATYTNLDPGSYVFRVKASNCDGVWNNEGTSVIVNIIPPFWKTWWFRILLIVVISILLYVVYLLKVRDIKRQGLLLEKIVKKRTEELNNSNSLLEERNEEILTQKEEVEAQKNYILDQKRELEHHRWNLEELVAERTAELEKAKNKAEESDRLKTAFLTNMSHEIRTPLNAIVGFSSLFFEPEISDEEKEEYQKQISQNTESLLLLINDILDLSKIESGQLEIINKEFSVNLLLEDIYSYWLFNKPKIELELLLANKEKQADIYINSDKYRIKQIITNLVSNAIKFTEKGYVELGFEIRDEMYCFYVKDTGIGIADENLNLIFERFRKVEDNKTRLYRGVGLGLAISNSIAEMLGGKLSVESKPETGSTFIFSLPVKAKMVEDIKVPIQKDVSEDQFNWTDKHILIVEDNDASYLFLKKVLEKTKANTQWAADGNTAVEYFRLGKTFDIVLMDIRLPGISGLQALKLIREINPEQKIIAQTAYASIKNEKEMLDAGFDDYLSKPTNVLLLLQKISDLLKK
jgi:signal transduction histidine kinase/ligand-binding sensor domain-containing protein/CheY-like chemotaxis protein